MSTSSAAKKGRPNGPSPAVKNYLIAYNVIQTLGWSYLLYQLINFYISPATASLYDTVKWTVIIFQNAALLEVVHAIVRFVPSNPLITAMQISSRVIVVCGVLMVTQAARETIGLPLALFAWSITEIIRYGNYALNLIGAIPFIVTWLRYTTFYVLYPIGVSGELLCIYAAQQEIAKTKVFTVEMPNSLNFIFNYQKILWMVMALYIPVFPKLFMHMVVLRKKVLGGAPQKKTQ